MNEYNFPVEHDENVIIEYIVLVLFDIHQYKINSDWSNWKSVYVQFTIITFF